MTVASRKCKTPPDCKTRNFGSMHPHRFRQSRFQGLNVMSLHQLQDAAGTSRYASSSCICYTCFGSLERQPSVQNEVQKSVTRADCLQLTRHVSP